MELTNLTSDDTSTQVKKNRRIVQYGWGNIWIKLILIIVVVSSFRALVLDSFKITSGSMEGTLLTGDYVFVRKFAFGARIPSSLAIPFLGNNSPLVKLFGIKVSTPDFLPYVKLPAFDQVKRDDIIAFNLPIEDLPVDAKTVYIKRCVALPGDRVSLQDGVLRVNSRIAGNYSYSFRRYDVLTPLRLDESILNGIGISDYRSQVKLIRTYDNAHALFHYEVNCDLQTFRRFIARGLCKEIKPVTEIRGFMDFDIYPSLLNNSSNKDNIPELWIPKKSVAFKLDENNSKYYYEVIKRYEGWGDVEFKNHRIWISKKLIDHYRFKFDYYYVLGDNRPASYDSRFWGFLPETHVLGKVGSRWLSLDEHGIRWRRMFTPVL